MTGRCARCSAPVEAPSGRYCGQHRREHAAHLTAQIDSILAGHAVKVEAARQASAARIPDTCGHRPADLIVIDGLHRCGVCVSAAASAPPLSFEERQIVRRFDEAPHGCCPLCDGVGEVQARLPHVLTWTVIPCVECSAAVER